MPDASVAVAAATRRVDRIEVRARWRVDAVLTGVAVADTAEVGCLDSRQVGFERDPAVVGRPVEDRAREPDRGGVVLRILPSVRVRPRPNGLVRRPVEVVVRRDAAADRYEERERGTEA